MFSAATDAEKYAQPAGGILLAGALLCLVLLSSACGRVDPVAKVALVAPFEGEHRQVGYDVLYSARLAVREINEAGGIGGTRVALVALDDGGSPETAAAAAESLIVDPAVVAVVGHWLGETTAAAAPLYADNGLAFIAGGEAPFQASEPESLPQSFIDSYAAVTPFDEMPGPFAGPAYQAYESLWRLMAGAQDAYGEITRESVEKASRQAR
jgi:ABC-type branched-subunit amino acid transport system substrate-binding protein